MTTLEVTRDFRRVHREAFVSEQRTDLHETFLRHLMFLHWCQCYHYQIESIPFLVLYKKNPWYHYFPTFLILADSVICSGNINSLNSVIWDWMSYSMNQRHKVFRTSSLVYTHSQPKMFCCNVVALWYNKYNVLTNTEYSVLYFTPSSESNSPSAISPEHC